jgi:hypothetical protein
MATSSSSSSSLALPLAFLLIAGLSLPFAGAQTNDDLSSGISFTDHLGCIHMPVIHSTNTKFFSKRAVEVRLANRSDVAYYAQCRL